MWTTCRRSASSDYHAEFHEGCYQKHTNPLNCGIISLDISGYHTDCNEGHGTVGELQWRGITFLNSRGTAWQGKDMGVAWAWHGREMGAAWHMRISLYSSSF
jgi:hypothetical protein